MGLKSQKKGPWKNLLSLRTRERDGWLFARWPWGLLSVGLLFPLHVDLSLVDLKKEFSSVWTIKMFLQRVLIFISRTSWSSAAEPEGCIREIFRVRGIHAV